MVAGRSRSTSGKSKTISKRNYEPHTHAIGKAFGHGKVYRTASAKLQRKRMLKNAETHGRVRY
jgi:hypothetical protein